MSEVCVVAGGTNGLGRALAEEALKNGVRPIVIGRSALELAEEEVWRGMSHRRMDLSQPDATEVAKLAAQCTEKLFFVAGRFLRKKFIDIRPAEFDALSNLHQRGYFFFLQAWHQTRISLGRPYHLIVIASTSAWRIRDKESVYCGTKAFQVRFTANVAAELVADLPGVKVLVINPGGIKTELFRDTDQDATGFMEPSEVARLIWGFVNHQNEPYLEYQVMRGLAGRPVIIPGAAWPEQPFTRPPAGRQS